MIDLAYRAYSHSFRLDPVIRSLMDTDFYKFLMGQILWKHHQDWQITFKLINRNKRIRLPAVISEQELRDQLDHVRSLRFEPNELIWLQGNTFYGVRGMFEPAYIDFLRTLRMPEYELRIVDNEFDLRFPGPGYITTYWEIYALAIISELRSRHGLKGRSRFELDVLYSKAKVKLWDKLQRLRALEGLNLTCFATRRRHSFLFHEWAIMAAMEALGDNFTGTSNTYLAMKHGLEAKGTNAHERPMVAAAIAAHQPNSSPDLVRASQYDVLTEWAQMYQDALLVMLPDTYGTTQFLDNAPSWVDEWTGIRYDSKEPIKAGEEGIAFWQHRGRDPRQKLALFADGLDDDKIIELHKHFHRRTRVGFGWGTLFANDFRGCDPHGSEDFEPISIICKPWLVNDWPTVKLSDNYTKSTGDAAEIARYREWFGVAGVADIPVFV